MRKLKIASYSPHPTLIFRSEKLVKDSHSAVKIFDIYYFCTFARNFHEIISPKKSMGFVTIDKDDNRLFINYKIMDNNLWII